MFVFLSTFQRSQKVENDRQKTKYGNWKDGLTESGTNYEVYAGWEVSTDFYLAFSTKKKNKKKTTVHRGCVYKGKAQGSILALANLLNAG